MNLPPPLRTLFFEDLSVGMTETLEKTVSSSDVVGFAQLTGDRNPIHLSEHFAARTSFGKRIAHGLYTASLISAVLGTRLPGPGAIYISQTLNFRAPVKIGDTVLVTVTVRELIAEKSARGYRAFARSMTRWCSTAKRWSRFRARKRPRASGPFPDSSSPAVTRRRRIGLSAEVNCEQG